MTHDALQPGLPFASPHLRADFMDAAAVLQGFSCPAAAPGMPPAPAQRAPGG